MSCHKLAGGVRGDFDQPRRLQMQKKAMAVAIATALGSPVIALAQTSTVQIYGTMYVEYAFINQGHRVGGDRVDVDILQTPGSNIGFKGEEKLGGGMSAWFQCESTADPRGQSQDGWCSRNSALGLKGGFGNVFIGNWDTPFKRTLSTASVGSNDTGVWGTAQLLTAGSTTVNGNTGRALFKRRQNNMIMYDSPNFAGFQVMAGYTAINHATANLDTQGNNKPRVWSLGAQYSAGPLYVSAGYERHKEFAGPTGVGTSDVNDHGWHFGAAYTWGPVRFGAVYTRQEFEHLTPFPGAESHLHAWQVGVDWHVVGPHGLRAAYTQAGDMEGTPGAPAIGSTQSQSRPGVPVTGSNDTGAKMWQIRYVYTFSKRTEFTFGYVQLNNDGNATTGGSYALFGVSPGSPGANQHAFAAGIRHRF
jgi:predicted porin